MCRSFNSKGVFERADLLMAAGFSSLVCASLVLVAPRVGILFLEIFAGLCLVGRGFAVRARLKRVSRLPLERLRPAVSRHEQQNPKARMPLLGRYELLLIVLVVLFYRLAAFLRSRGFTAGFLRVLPLAFFGLALLVKPRVLGWVEAESKKAVTIKDERLTDGEGRQANQAEPASCERR